MADQTVTVNLQLLYDPRSGRAFQQMAAEAAKASKAANKAVAGEFATRSQALAGVGGIASNLGAYGAANSIGRTGAFADGLQGAGMTGAARFAQRAAVPLAVAGALGGAAENVAGYAYDKYSTNQQIGRSIVRDFVPFGQRAQKFVDSMSGRTAGYEEADIQARYRAADVQGRSDRAAFDLQFNPQQAGREALATAYRGQSAVTGSVFDRSSAMGERAFREEQRILPLKQAEAKAERDMAVAAREQLATQRELNKLNATGADLTRKRAALVRDLNRDENQSGVSRQNVLKGIETIDLESGANLAARRSALDANLGANQRLIEARTERQKAAVRSDLLGQAETLDSRAATAQGAASRLGGQSQFDRAFGLQAARLVKARGSTDGLPSDYVQAALGYAPETIGKIIEKTGAASSEFKTGVKEFEADFGGDPEELRRKAAELRKQAGEAEFKLDASAASQLAETGRDFGRFVGDTMTKLVERAKGEILRTVQLGRNAN